MPRYRKRSGIPFCCSPTDRRSGGSWGIAEERAAVVGEDTKAVLQIQIGVGKEENR